MNGKLIRTLSTGRTGTKFVAELFADQGFVAYHESLYLGEPRSAIMLYTHMLGDLWNADPESYFALESDFAKPYTEFVLNNLGEETQRDKRSISRPARLSVLFSSPENRNKAGVIIDTAHITTTATPLIERELKSANIESKYLILFRNPIMTIQAIFIVEGFPKNKKRPYWSRPVSFSRGEGLAAAANVWANTYRLAQDQKRHLGSEKFRLLQLESFSKEEEYAAATFEFLGLQLDRRRFRRFVERELSKPLRSSKEESARNSHLFHDPNRFFLDSEIRDIFNLIKDVIEVYEIDWDRTVADYRRFHELEKNKIGFA